MTTPIEPNKSKTIPLHIADQAVAACEAEIQKLREENARLKHQLKLCGEIEVCASVSTGKSILPEMLENARLKAENDWLRKAGDDTNTEVSAEIVQSFNTETGEASFVVSLQDYQKMADFFNSKFARLKTENERLRKAGDAMAERCLKMSYTEVPWEYGPKWYAWHSKAEASVNAWNAAKDGKPTE